MTILCRVGTHSRRSSNNQGLNDDLKVAFNAISYTLFYKQHFYKQGQADIGKNQAKAKQDPEAELFLFENYSLSSSTLPSKNKKGYSRKCTKNKCVCFNEVI